MNTELTTVKKSMTMWDAVSIRPPRMRSAYAMPRFICVIAHFCGKAALAPFKDKLDDLRAALNAMQQSPGDLTSGQSKVLGKSFTPALGLPVDPKL